MGRCVWGGVGRSWVCGRYLPVDAVGITVETYSAAKLDRPLKHCLLLCACPCLQAVVGPRPPPPPARVALQCGIAT